ncbi:MAG TPA: restriction endonuclease subunit S [Acidimicrobiia bacterium]|nr:restriction endonuclease subunit S [Acidimicrobiia bacterium]
MNELPAGWKRKALSDVADIILGQSPPGTSYNTEGRGVPFFQGKAEFGDLYPEIRKWTTAPKKLAKAGDVLISVRAPVGPTNVAQVDCAVGRGLAALRVRNGMPTKYLLYAVRVSSLALASKATGTTFSAISGDQLKAHFVAVAPVDEQQRIVEAIEEQFSRLDAGIESLQRAKRNLASLRASILNTAANGSWEAVPIGDLAALEPRSITDGPFGSNLKTAHYTDEGPRVVRLQNIGDGRFVDDRAHISEEHFASLQNHSVEAGDVLIASLGKDLPRSCIAPDWLGRAIVKADCIRFRPGPRVEGRFVSHMLNSRTIRHTVAEIIHGVGRPRLNLREIKAIRIPVPTVDVQHRIVAEVDRQFSIIDAMAKTIDAGLQRAGTLRQSILSQAFSGRLTGAA